MGSSDIRAHGPPIFRNEPTQAIELYTNHHVDAKLYRSKCLCIFFVCVIVRVRTVYDHISAISMSVHVSIFCGEFMLLLEGYHGGSGTLE